MEISLQPTLEGPRLLLRPLAAEEFEVLFAAASDPKIWEVHPQPTRYQRDVFRKFFDGAITSRGALAIIDKATGQMIGSSRYYQYDPKNQDICIGYTFMARNYWGGSYNRELKSLMINHILPFVKTIKFEVGISNWRSRRAMEKIGGVLVGEAHLDGKAHVIYAISSRLSE